MAKPDRYSIGSGGGSEQRPHHRTAVAVIPAKVGVGDDACFEVLIAMQGGHGDKGVGDERAP